MKYVFVSFLALLICLSAFSQRKGKEYFLLDSVYYDSLPEADRSLIDSLIPLYHAAAHDTDRLNLLVELAEGLNTESLWPRYNDFLFRKSEQILKDSSALSANVLTAVKRSYAMSLQNKGYFEENYGGTRETAREYYNRCLKIQEEINDEKGLAVTLNNIGLTFSTQGNGAKALEYYLASIAMQEKTNDKRGMAYGMNNIAAVHLEQGDTVKALEYQLQSIKLREETGDKHGLAISLSNIGVIYNARGEIDKALEYFIRARQLWQELGEKQGLAYTFQFFGTIYQQKGERLEREGKNIPDTLFSKAIDFMTKSLALYESIGDKRGQSGVLVLIGNHYLHKKDMGKALSSGLRSIAIGKEIGYPANIRNASILLYTIYKEQGNWKEALAMHELSIRMRDSISNAATKKATVQKQMKYEYEKQQALQELEHQKELAIAEEGKKRQQIISYAAGSGFVMLILFSIFIFNRLQVTRKQKLLIEDQKKIVENKNKHITDSINYAKRIQDSILPSQSDFRRYFTDHFLLFRPKDVVSGDFYWLSHQNGKTILAVADCTGHGVPGAFMSMIGNTLLNEIVNEQHILEPADILHHLNEGIIQALHQESRTQDDGMDISVCSFDKAQNLVIFAGANHSMYVSGQGALREIKGDIYSIGSMFGPKDDHGQKKSSTFTQKEIALQKDSMLYFTTDGFPDQIGGEKGKKFMLKKLEALFTTLSPLSIKEQESLILKTFEEWKNGYAQLDDVLVAGIKL